MVNKNFVSNVTSAQAIFEFITGDKISIKGQSHDACMSAKFALNCQDPVIVLDMRKLNARPKNDSFDQFWAMMSDVVDGRVSDRRHGELPLSASCFYCFLLLLVLTNVY